MRNVIRRAMPGGLTNIILVILAGMLTSTFNLPDTHLNTIAVWLLAAVGLITLYHVSKPFTKLRLIVFAAMSAAMLFCLLLIPGFFEIPAINYQSGLIMVVLLLTAPTLMRFFLLIFDRQVAKHDQRSPREKRRRR